MNIDTLLDDNGVISVIIQPIRDIRQYLVTIVMSVEGISGASILTGQGTTKELALNYAILSGKREGLLLSLALEDHPLEIVE